MPTVILTVPASELRQGDTVLCHGMRVLLDRPVENRPYASVTESQRHGNTDAVYWCNGLVTNVSELSDEWLVGITRQYEEWPNRHVPTGEHRWQVQSNDLVRWQMERELPADTVCSYSARHAADGIDATTTIDCGPVGIVAACDRCAAFYASMA